MSGHEPGVALVTGGGTGVGAATAGLLARRGWAVVINYNQSVKAAEETASLCRNAGAPAIAVQGDVSRDEDCRRVVETTVNALGSLDLLVNSAGTTQVTKFSDLAVQNSEEMQRIYSVNVIGAYQMARAASAPLQSSGRGAIVNVSSVAGETGSGSSLGYALSKGALNTLTLALARLFAPNVRVNAILPGMIETDWFTANGMDGAAIAAMKRQFCESSALRDVCAPQDIADAIVYAGLDARKMTGHLLKVDAGMTLGKPPTPID